MTIALEYRRSPLRYVAMRGATGSPLGGRISGTVASTMAPLKLVNHTSRKPASAGWTRLRPLLAGICGSDLGLLTARSSPYLSPVISLPFVPGHEVVAETLDDLPGLPKGSRVVVDPVLSCAARALPPCQWCRRGQTSRCDHVTTGRLAAGLQTGFCSDTGGGWSQQMVAHESQLHPVPDSLDERRAVLVEPLACAIHSVRRMPLAPGASVLVVGAGTVGLLTLLALRAFSDAGPIYLVAKYEHQRRRARELGATEVLTPSTATRTLRRVTGAALEQPIFGPEFLLGGVDVAFECTGNSGGLDTALRLVRAGGSVLLSGMPSGQVDLTPLWFRELQLIGSYASGSSSATAGGSGSHQSDIGSGSDFAEAIALAGEAPLDGYVDAVYPLSRWRDAIGHASAAGRLGTVKVAFDPSRD